MTANRRAPPTAAELGLMQGAPPPADKRVGLDSWDIGPHNRWAFQHLSELLPTAAIGRGHRPPVPLARAETDLGRLWVELPSGEPCRLIELLEVIYTDGFIALRDGRVAFEMYFNGMRPDTKHLLMSVSKSVTAVLAGAMAAAGQLGVEAAISDHVSELAAGAYGDATVRDLLDMTVSVRFREAYGDPEAEIARYDQASGWRGGTDLSAGGVSGYLPTLAKDARPHGTTFHYVSANTDVLAWVMERASGQRYADLLSDHIWSRLGAEHDAYVTVDSRGSAIASGGICATLRDVARFAQAMLDEGQTGGIAIVPREWVADTRRNGDRDAWKGHELAVLFGQPDGCYRNNWYVTNNPQGAYFASGIHGQLVWIDPAARTVVVILASQPTAMDPEMIRASLATAAAVSSYLATP